MQQLWVLYFNILSKVLFITPTHPPHTHTHTHPPTPHTHTYARARARAHAWKQAHASSQEKREKSIKMYHLLIIILFPLSLWSWMCPRPCVRRHLLLYVRHVSSVVKPLSLLKLREAGRQKVETWEFWQYNKHVNLCSDYSRLYRGNLWEHCVLSGVSSNFCVLDNPTLPWRSKDETLNKAKHIPELTH